MKVGERNIAVLLNDEGRQVLQLAAVNLAESPFLWVYADDSDDLGPWARIAREDGDHLVLIRWEYILALDFPAGPVKTLGIR